MANQLDKLSAAITQYTFNKRSLHAKSGPLNKIQIENAFRLVLDTLIEKYPGPDGQAFKTIQPEVNVVTDTFGNMFGDVFIDVGKDGEKLYNVLTGLNIDGTERKLTAFDGKVPPDFDGEPTSGDVETYVQQRLKELDDLDHDGSNTWDGRINAEDSIREEIPKIIVTQDIPLIVMPAIKLNPEQKESLVKLLIERSTPNKNLYPKSDDDYRRIVETIIKPTPRYKHFINDPQGFIDYERKNIEEYRQLWLGDSYVPLPDKWDPRWDKNLPVFIPDNFEPPTKLGINIERTFVKDNPDVDKSILMCYGAPKWVTKEMIEKVFGKFNTDPRLVSIPEGDTVIVTSFPYVRITPSSLPRGQEKKDEWGESMNTISVLFSKNGDSQWDALFAEKMRKQVVLAAPKCSLRGDKTKTLIFYPKKNTPLHGVNVQHQRMNTRMNGGVSRARGAVVSDADAAAFKQKTQRSFTRDRGDCKVRDIHPTKSTPTRQLPPNRSFIAAVTQPREEYPASPVARGDGGMKDVLTTLRGINILPEIPPVEIKKQDVSVLPSDKIKKQQEIIPSPKQKNNRASLATLPKKIAAVSYPNIQTVESPAPSPAIWESGKQITPVPTPVRTVYTPTSFEEELQLTVEPLPLPPLPNEKSFAKKGPIKTLPPLKKLTR